MKLKNFTAAALSAVVVLSAMSSYIVTNADENTEQQSYTLSFNLDYEGFESENPELFESVELKAGGQFPIPEGMFSFGTTDSNGWTADGVYLYQEGDYFIMPTNDVVLEPVWVDYSKSDLYTVSYNYEGDDYNILSEEPFKSKKLLPGQAVSVSSGSIMRSGYTQLGWVYENNYFNSSTKMIMPEHDVTFEPNWLKHYQIYYEAGDVNGVLGNSVVSFTQTETYTFDLGNSSRLSRSGYALSGWLCDVDGKIYDTGSQYKMPSSDVHFLAVWTPKASTITFKSNNGMNQTVKIVSQTDDIITVPECTFTKSGCIFGGWEYNGTIYREGDEFVVPGSMFGISINALWIEEESIHDSLELAKLRQQYVDGTATEEELRNSADFILGRIN